jgi:hypothetical protein
MLNFILTFLIYALFVVILENNFGGNFNFDLTEKIIHVEDFY